MSQSRGCAAGGMHYTIIIPAPRICCAPYGVHAHGYAVLACNAVMVVNSQQVGDKGRTGNGKTSTTLLAQPGGHGPQTLSSLSPLP